MNSVKNLSELRKGDAAVAGGKGASLGELINAGISVPSGFVVVAGAFDEFLSLSGLDVEIEAALNTVDHREMHTVENASEKIHALILRTELPVTLKAEFLAAFKKLGATFVAVRSSATAEDGETAAWAGQLETYLNTTEENLIENVLKCWASLFSPRAIFYRFQKNMKADKVSVAVVVQEMVESEKSGIAFSVHPVTQDRNQMIIEAGLGLGEAIVSGTITPDSYVVRKNDLHIIERQTYVQNKGLFRKKNGGNEWRNIGEKEGSSPTLSDKETCELAALIVKIEKHYGFPVDVEWAQAKGAWFITQSRPITTLSAEVPAAGSNEFKFMWGQKQSAMISEAMMWQAMNTITVKAEIVPSGIPETLFVMKDGIFEHFMPVKSYAHIAQFGERYMEKSFPPMLAAIIDKHVRDFFDFAAGMDEKTLKKLADAKLLKLVEAYQTFYNRTFAFFGTSSNWWTDALTNRMRAILREKADPSDSEQYFIDLCTPPELDETMKERLDFFDLVEAKKTTVKDMEGYARRFPALFFNTYDRKEVHAFLASRAKEEKSKDFDAERRRILGGLTSIRKKQEEIYREVPDHILKYCAETLQRSALDRYRLKHVWSGGEYVCLDLLKEVQRRIGVPFEDFIKTYTFTDMKNFLATGTSLDANEVKRRKLCMVMHSKNGDVRLVSGEKALKHMATLLPSVTESAAPKDAIKGQIANKGMAKGKARVVFVKDLKQFQHDSRLFKKGEILVTTMTSPVMIPLIEKAAGIITDEGGICSHAAVSAREFGIPCIIGTHGASGIIKTGDDIELDANRGTVTMLNKPSALTYEFSWGERHSVMTAEMWATSYLKFQKLLANENRHVFMHVKGGFVHTYTAAEELLAASEAGTTMLRPTFLKEYLNDSKGIRVAFRKLYDRVQKTDLKRASNEKLADILRAYVDAFEYVYALFKITQPEYTTAAADALRSKVTALIGVKNVDKALAVLSSDLEHDPMKLDELAALKLSLKPTITEKDLHAFVEEFPWYFFNTYDRKLAADFLQRKFDDLRSIPAASRKKTLEDAKKALSAHRKEHAVWLTKTKKDPDIAYLSTLLGTLGSDRLELKKWWTGSEYLFLDFFDEISKRMGLETEEMLMTHRRDEIYDALKGKKIPSSLRASRKKSYAVFLSEDTVEFLEHTKADDEFTRLVHPSQSKSVASGKNSIMGTVANPGIARGTARIIRVEDLKTLLKDMKRFKKDEIIVTTMTQPTVVGLARIAAAIVTDEGGITSHAAILAREYGIPCIVGAKVATHIIKDGDIIEVNATKGTVKIIG